MAEITGIAARVPNPANEKKKEPKIDATNLRHQGRKSKVLATLQLGTPKGFGGYEKQS